MARVEWQGKTVETGETFPWNGHKLKIMEEIQDEKYGRVLYAYVDYCKSYIIRDEIVTDQAIIDYLDDHYGTPVGWRGLVF